MCEDLLLCVQFMPSAATDKVFDIQGAQLAVPLLPAAFVQQFPQYWLDKDLLTGNDVICTMIAEKVKQPYITFFTGATNYTINGVVRGRPIRRPNPAD